MVMEDDGVINVKLRLPFMHQVWTCCTRITLIFPAWPIFLPI